jgi:hypothetical protein
MEGGDSKTSRYIPINNMDDSSMPIVSESIVNGWNDNLK